MLEGIQPGMAQEGETVQNDVEKKTPEHIFKPISLEDLPPLYELDIDQSMPKLTYRQRLLQCATSTSSISQLLLHVYQPFHILACIPGILYMAVIYGVTLAVSTIIGTNMAEFMASPPYNFSPSAIGLMTLPVFVGTAIGMAIVGPTCDKLILYLAKRNGGIYEPEMRLWMIIIFIPLIPVGIMMAGCGYNYSLPWPVIAVGFATVFVGVAPANSVALTYVTDAYTEVRKSSNF
jgi:MFS family permease